jgi:serine kinase of HPr protein (carbohydrate metabolism regulator)
VILHATLIAERRGGEWRGVLMRGASGAGKSGLAIQLVRQGWRLVADDRVLVWRSGGRLFGRAPDRLRGLIEVRTVGVCSTRALAFVEICRVVDAADDPAALDRVPDPSFAEIEGVVLPRLRLDLRTQTAAPALRLWCGAEGV